MNILNKYNFCIFDCDGVILNSNELKVNAYRYALSEYSKTDVNKLIDYHKKNGGISRYMKFNFFFNNILKISNFEQEYNNTLKKFEIFLKEHYHKAQFVDGVIKTFDFFIKNKKNIYIVSGSDEKELINLFNFKNLTSKFNLILGSPKDKIINTKKIINLEKNKLGVFFGDSRQDYICAKKFNLDFIFVKQFSEWKDLNLKEEKNFSKVIFNFNDFTLF